MFDSDTPEISNSGSSVRPALTLTPTADPVQRLLEQELSLLRLAQSDAGRAVYHWDLKAKQLSWSSNLSLILPFLDAATLAQESDLIALIHPEDRPRFLEMRHTLGKNPVEFSIQYRLVPGDGEIYRIRQAGAPCPGESQAMLGVFELTTGTENARTPLRPRAEEDAPFPFHYPQSFLNRLQDTIENCKREEKLGALLMVSIDNLAMIINGYGTEASELVIANLISEIKEILAASDIVERLHREQIGIILSCSNKEEVQYIADRIHSIARNYGHHSAVGSVHVICSIASVDFPTTVTAADALDKAYIALSDAHGYYYRSFEDMQDAVMQSRQQMSLANYLRKAMDEGRLRLAYQPIIESKTGKIVHYEALLRLIGEDGKISSAGALIPIAERMGLIDIIDRQVLEMVVKELQNSPDVVLAFNVSNMTTDNPKWLEHFNMLLQDQPEIASRMIVEITETAAQRDLRRAAYFVASVQAMGASVALDDFGSGYTSFRQLKALSVDMVKIDGVFVKDLVDNPDNRFFVKTLLEFTNGFGLKAVAEFVENGECAKMLMELGVEYMQGYYFGKPENHRSWLKEGEFNRG